MTVSFLVACFFQFGAGPLALEEAMSGAGWFRLMDFTSWKLVLGIAITTVAWLAVTYLTPPVDDETLIAFNRKLRPGGPGWKRFEAASFPAGAAERPRGWNVPIGLLCMMTACLMVWATLFGVGYLLYGRHPPGCALILLAAGAGWTLSRLAPRIN